jgi:ketosteroid isomerase-like protein
MVLAVGRHTFDVDTSGRVPSTNASVVQALNELWNRGVRSVPTEYFDPAFELESPFASVSGEPYRGYEGIERWVRDVDEQFSEWGTQMDDVQELEDTVIAIGRLRGRARASGIELDQPYALVCYFAETGRITRARIYWDVAAAREAVFG